MKKASMFASLLLSLGFLACSCDLFDADAQHEVSVTVFLDVSSMDTRNNETMTISVPGSEDQTLNIHYNPNVTVVGNLPYSGVDAYDVVTASWYGKKEITIHVSVSGASADIAVSKEKHYFLYRYPGSITQ